METMLGREREEEEDEGEDSSHNNTNHPEYYKGIFSRITKVFN